MTSANALIPMLGDWHWRIHSGCLYKIKVKSPGTSASDPGMIVPFIPNPAQKKLLSRLWHRNVLLKARQMGFCLDPATPILMADLTWRRLADVRPGDRVVACDEFPPGGKGPTRSLRIADVVATAVTRHDHAYRLHLASGAVVTCSGNHRWLSRSPGQAEGRWRMIEEPSKARLKVGCAIRRACASPSAADPDDGWMAGILDGEGSLALATRTGASLCAFQRPGPVFDRMVAWATRRGLPHRIEEDHREGGSKLGLRAVHKIVFGRLDTVIDVLAACPTTRFRERMIYDGKAIPGKRTGANWDEIVRIERVDTPHDLIDIQTSTGTFVASGLISHNSTAIAILALDHALWNADQNVVLIAHTLDDAENLFRDKIKLAYDNLPDAIRAYCPLVKSNDSQLIFANGSSIRVTTSARSATVQFLHVSEMGKIAAQFPHKAREITTGSLQAVPSTGIAIIESTAEGQAGEFYDIASTAENLQKQGADGVTRQLDPSEYRFHFFPWWQDPSYRSAPGRVIITTADHAYFDKIEGEMGCEIDLDQRTWYVAKRDTDFRTEPELMWREYPSTPGECWQASTRGKILAEQMAKARREGRIGHFPLIRHVPCNTFWDLGATDSTVVWVHQRIGGMDRWVNYREATGEGYLPFILWLDRLGCVWDTHYLPHDGGNTRQGAESVYRPIDVLRDIRPMWNWQIVPRVHDLQHGIDQLRLACDTYQFHEETTKQGIVHLDAYSRPWNRTLQTWASGHLEDGHEHAPDAIRQHAQGFDLSAFDPALDAKKKANRRAGPRNIRRSGVTV
jgi:hypothetical protein